MNHRKCSGSYDVLGIANGKTPWLGSHGPNKLYPFGTDRLAGHAGPETISQMLEVVDDANKKLYTKRYIVQFLFALRKSYCRSLTNDS